MAVWHNAYIQVIMSSITVYLFMIVAIRLFGKKELSQLSVVDLVFILLISNAVQNAMVGSNTTLAGGLVAAGALFVVNYLLKQFLYRFPRFGKLLQGETLLLIYAGKLNESNLNKARMTIDEMMEAIREHGISRMEDVDLAVLEVDGNISVLSDQFQQRSVRKRKSKQSVFQKQG